MFNIIKSSLKKFINLSNAKETNNQLLINLAKLHFDNISKIESKNFTEHEYKVFSQFGEDGLINLILNNINIKNKYFIEFGVEDYEESNTKLLLEGFNWSGTIFDCNSNFISKIKKKSFYWKYNISVFEKFITSENVNSIITENCQANKISLLSIDVDGNDYWIWKAIDCIDPELVIIEYNSIFGVEKSVTTPYREVFDRKKFHYSNSYFGATLTALYNLGIKKNYILVGTNFNGNNAFFVKKNSLKKDSCLKAKSPEECFNMATFKEARDNNGNIIEVNKNKIKKEIFQLPLIEV